ncbi:unnamed protein product [Rotaria sordida]|uniref:ADP-ribosylglycohydrolase n=1 Tax=Rotaria sordida TaxID=392033 RepID=A0A813YX15_9BILA|nr:unnamed protein product [Rotaria sordida]CAF0986715.1 unnamed protein product [Rotaria sordida]
MTPEDLQTVMKNPPVNVDDAILDRVQGSMVGMALGDALGGHVEFRPRQYLLQHPVRDLVGGGTWGLKKGQFTDDTSMALCLASSLVIHRDFIPYDQLVRYKWWHKYGYMSSTGQCFDIGTATRQSLREFERRQRKFADTHQIRLEHLDHLSDPHLLDQFDVYCSEDGVADEVTMSSSATIWLITVGWSDASLVDFLVRSSCSLTTKLDIYHWFFTHINDKILQFDYSPLDNIEGDLDLSQILNNDIEHENLNINHFEDFMELKLDEIELFMRENGRAHGMVVTVDKAKQQNYQIINLDNDPTSTVWKVTYNPRFLNCICHKNLPNLYDLQRTTRSNYLWQIHTKQEHEVYQYIFKNLNLFHIDTLPDLMNKTQDDLIKLVELPLEQTDYQIISEMISLQCCHRNNQHEHHHSEQQVFVILVEPALNLLDIIDI